MKKLKVLFDIVAEDEKHGSFVSELSNESFITTIYVPDNFENWDKQKQEEYLGSEKTQRKIMCYPTNIRICEHD